MATIRTSIDLEVPIEEAWDKIADLGGVTAMISFLVDAEVDGDRRVCTMADGGKLEEEIISVDPSLHRVAYTITDSPFGFTFHAAAMELVPTPRGCRFVWTTDVKPDALAQQLSPIFDSETKTIASALGGAGEVAT